MKKIVFVLLSIFYFGVASTNVSANFADKIPNYAKAQNVEQEIEKQGEKVTNIALTIVIAIMFIALIVGVGFLATGFQKGMAVTILVCDAIAAGVLGIGYAALNYLLS